MRPQATCNQSSAPGSWRTRRLALLALMMAGALTAASQKTNAELQAELAQMQATIASLQAQAQTAGETPTGASPAPDCETVLHKLLASLAVLSEQGRRQAANLGSQVRETQGVITQATGEVREAQNENAGAAQAAVVKAAADARNTQLTQILGFLTVMGTIGARAWTERNHHSETAGRLDELGQHIQRRSTDRPADGDDGKS